jgi:hypothetical protein
MESFILSDARLDVSEKSTLVLSVLSDHQPNGRSRAEQPYDFDGVPVRKQSILV